MESPAISFLWLTKLLQPVVKSTMLKATIVSPWNNNDQVNHNHKSMRAKPSSLSLSCLIFSPQSQSFHHPSFLSLYNVCAQNSSFLSFKPQKYKIRLNMKRHLLTLLFFFLLLDSSLSAPLGEFVGKEIGDKFNTIASSPNRKKVTIDALDKVRDPALNHITKNTQVGASPKKIIHGLGHQIGQVLLGFACMFLLFLY
ncbi:hypothetical protein HN51_069386 [Arachis hypogaea]